jgi:hypothetical protein
MTDSYAVQSTEFTYATPTPYAVLPKLAVLMHFDGTDGTQVFTDEVGNTWTPSSSGPVLSAADAVLGNAALSMTNGADYLTTLWPTTLSLSGAFTIEFRWTVPVGFASNNIEFLASDYGDVDGDTVFLILCTSGTLQFYGGTYGSSDARYSFSDFAFTEGATYAIAFSRDSNDTLRAFLNGTQSQYTYTSTIDWDHVGYQLRIGSSDLGGSPGQAFGVMDELRITSDCLILGNYAVATSEFANTEPTPYAPLPPVVQVLMHFEGTSGSTDFVDTSTNAYTAFTPGTGVILDSTQSKFGGTSLLIPDASNYLSLNINSTTLGLNDWCIDFWAYPNTETGSEIYYGMFTSTNSGGSPWCIYNNGGNMTFYVGGNICSTTIAGNDAWMHVEVSRTNGTFYIFVNGTITGSPSIQPTYDFGSYLSLQIGNCSAYGARASVGWIDEFRFITGQGSGHTASFSPPTAPYADP